MAGTAKTDLAAIMTNDTNSGGNVISAADIAAGTAIGVDLVSAVNAVRAAIEQAAYLVYQIQNVPSLSGGLTTLLNTVATDLT
ncbi:MAG: hypothetical protein KGR26_06130 [Cyanobacteria bacterium REEB65]|nr:hypothetical protein [Cyanobacteria bacterium REEB65]